MSETYRVCIDLEHDQIVFLIEMFQAFIDEGIQAGEMERSTLALVLAHLMNREPHKKAELTVMPKRETL